jgi:mono/diheme cytochrome c family protein
MPALSVAYASTFQDFIRAMRKGIAPDGSHYFPSFPFTSFTRMTDEDMKALWAHLLTLEPVAKPNREHDVPFPFRLRFLQRGWKLLFFERGPFRPDPDRSPEWNRGAYLVEAVAHCGECHTPRNAFGALNNSRKFSGAVSGPDGETVPNITPDPESGIGKWSDTDIEFYLSLGVDPDGDYAGSLMAEVIEDGTAKLSEADLRAIVTYLRTIPPVGSGSGE